VNISGAGVVDLVGDRNQPSPKRCDGTGAADNTSLAADVNLISGDRIRNTRNVRDATAGMSGRVGRNTRIRLVGR
jgi:hypothetical protein